MSVSPESRPERPSKNMEGEFPEIALKYLKGEMDYPTFASKRDEIYGLNKPIKDINSTLPPQITEPPVHRIREGVSVGIQKARVIFKRFIPKR